MNAKALLATGFLVLLGCTPPASPLGTAPGTASAPGSGEAAAGAEEIFSFQAHERHRDFGRKSVHLLGAIEGLGFAAAIENPQLLDFFRQMTLRDAQLMLDAHGDFPPHPAALDDPATILAWQDAMAEVRLAGDALKLAGDGSATLAAGKRLHAAFLGAFAHSGYPRSFAEFLALRGTAKMTRDLEPELRHARRAMLVRRLGEQRQAFAAARRELLSAEERIEFDRRLDRLYRELVEMVQTPGPIPTRAVEDLHEHFPAFQSLVLLDELLMRQRQMSR